MELDLKFEEKRREMTAIRVFGDSYPQPHQYMYI